ncbi:DNA polymerase III subunit delta [Cesiribacter andamanensis AMV16]|uniref:DNA polymerase III subunit delta n=2 Tax=Cesiribacter TaxID=1133570 RepID=M7NSD4_9BACT|nr:DNA polymerase III subunit delta [Cesiribacter andamanensis AMV16]
MKAGKLAPIYFLQGDEPYYIDLLSDYIEQQVLSESEKGFNQMVLYGKDAPMATILNQARRFPMMSERQVVLVKEAQEIPDLAKEEGKRLLESYVKNPLPSTILVFCHKYKTLDGRSALAKVLDKHAVVVTTKKLYDNQLPDWIEQHIKSTGNTVDPKAAYMLAEYIGNDLSRLANEVQKLLLNFSEKVKIDSAMVQKYVGISKEYNTFELQKALAVRDVVKANQIVQYFEGNPKSNPAILVIAFLFSYYSKLLLLHHQKAYHEGEVAKVLGMHPFVAKEYLPALRNYPPQKVVQNISWIHQADLQSKGIIGGSISDGQILKELVFKLMH